MTSNLTVNESSNISNILPYHWTMKDYEIFKNSYDFILIKDKRIFCKDCCEYDEYNKNSSSPYVVEGIKNDDHNKNENLKKIRDKLSRHKNTKSHQNNKNENIMRNSIVGYINDRFQTEKEKMRILFTLAYYIALNNRPFTDYEKLIKLLGAIRIDTGLTLKDRNTCTKIVDLIAKRMKKNLFNMMKASNSPFALILDESDTIVKEFKLVVYIRTIIKDKVRTFFAGLINLEDRNGKAITEKIIEFFHANKLDDVFLQKNYFFSWQQMVHL